MKRQFEDGANVTVESELDIPHLTRQTLGDRALRDEVLRLFDHQAVITLALIKAATDPSVRREAAHALVGAARGVGAFPLARAAGVIEANPVDSADGISALEEAIERARWAIDRSLSD